MKVLVWKFHVVSTRWTIGDRINGCAGDVWMKNLRVFHGVTRDLHSEDDLDCWG